MHLYEHVLCEVVGLRPIGHHTAHHRIHEVLVTIDELTERRIVAGPAALDQLAFVEVRHPPALLEAR